jgi:hypothetical protein
MPTHRIDALAQLLAARQPRRQALRRGTAGLLAAAGIAPMVSKVAAQTTPTPGAAEQATGSDLFVQTFRAGTLTPMPGAAGHFTLSLEGDVGQTVYFSDRPARRVGLIPTAVLLEQLGFTPADPPNAALVAQTPEGEDILVVMLSNPRYDQAAGALAYDVQLLAHYTGAGLADLAARQDDDQFAPSFLSPHLFIDGCGRGQCWDGNVQMCVSCSCFTLGVQGSPCLTGTQNPCYDASMQCEANPGSPPGAVGACWYP